MRAIHKARKWLNGRADFVVIAVTGADVAALADHSRDADFARAERVTNWYNLANGRFRLGPEFYFGRASHDGSSAALHGSSLDSLDHHLILPGAARQRS